MDSAQLNETIENNNKESKSPHDAILEIPNLKVDNITVKIEEIKAHLALKSQVKGMVDIGVGARVELNKVTLEVQNINAQANLKLRLDRVKNILNNTIDTLDKNPELLRSIVKIKNKGSNAGEFMNDMAGEFEEAADEVEESAGGAVHQAKNAITNNRLARGVKNTFKG